MTQTPGMTHEKTPALRRVPSSTGAAPVTGSLLKTVTVTFHLSGAGYLVSFDAAWVDPLSRPGLKVKDVVKHYRITRWLPYSVRPGLRELLRAAAHSVWDMSTRDVVARLDGEDPLPTL